MKIIYLEKFEWTNVWLITLIESFDWRKMSYFLCLHFLKKAKGGIKQ